MSEPVLFSTFDQIESKKLQWLWYPYIPLGHLTLVYGDKEDIVSSFLIEVTSRLSTRQIGDNHDESKGILFAIGDKDPSWIKRELEKRGRDTTQIGYMDVSDLNNLLSAKDKLKEAGVRRFVDAAGIRGVPDCKEQHGCKA